MQVTPISAYTPVQSLAPSQAVADVLPKHGEAAVDAAFAPIEPLSQTQPHHTDQDGLVYQKPQAQPQAEANTSNDSPALENKPAAESEEQNPTDEQILAEEKMLQELKARDQEVRTHEQLHKAVAGRYAGAISYTLQQGPDGRRYAVGGEVSIDMSEVSNDPQATLEKMQQIQRAALAPNEPSSQDRQVASEAGQKAAQALNELAAEKRAVRQEAEQALKVERELAEEKRLQAKKQQEEAEEKAQQDEPVSAAERFASYNNRMSQINETLLKLSLPQQPSAGQLINARI